MGAVPWVPGSSGVALAPAVPWVPGSSGVALAPAVPVRPLALVSAPSYDLCAVSNHHGTVNGRHYASYCKPPQDVWYQCDDKTVTKLRTPVKTSTAYLLFYDSVHADI